MKLAIVIGGWHWPLQPFVQLAVQAPGADLFAIGHRSPDLPVVQEEKRQAFAAAERDLPLLPPDGLQRRLLAMDRELYSGFATADHLRELGWNYEEAPNTCGDWEFLNQWLAMYGYKRHDLILNLHDDTLIFPGIVEEVVRRRNDGWLLLGNGRYPEAPPAYVRGSCEAWKPELIAMLGGRIDLGSVRLTREGKTDTPAGLQALSEWNNTGVPLRDYMVRHGLADRVQYLSPYYRVSKWAIEAERGFLHRHDGAPWSFEAGLEHFGMIRKPVSA